MTTLPYTTPEAAAIKARWLAERDLAAARPNAGMFAVRRLEAPGVRLAWAVMAMHAARSDESFDVATIGR